MSGEGPLETSPPRDFGRRMVDARRSLLGIGLANPDVASIGAVWGVRGVYGEAGVFVFFLDEEDGPMAILARESFIEIERSRLCAEGLFAGIAVVAAGFAKGSVLRKACVAGDMGVDGAIWWEWRNCVCVVWIRFSSGRAPVGT